MRKKLYPLIFREYPHNKNAMNRFVYIFFRKNFFWNYYQHKCTKYIKGNFNPGIWVANFMKSRLQSPIYISLNVSIRSKTSSIAPGYFDAGECSYSKTFLWLHAAFPNFFFARLLLEKKIVEDNNKSNSVKASLLSYVIKKNIGV